MLHVALARRRASVAARTVKASGGSGAAGAKGSAGADAGGAGARMSPVLRELLRTGGRSTGAPPPGGAPGGADAAGAAPPSGGGGGGGEDEEEAETRNIAAMSREPDKLYHLTPELDRRGERDHSAPTAEPRPT